MIDLPKLAILECGEFALCKFLRLSTLWLLSIKNHYLFVPSLSYCVVYLMIVHVVVNKQAHVLKLCIFLFSLLLVLIPFLLDSLTWQWCHGSELLISIVVVRELVGRGGMTSVCLLMYSFGNLSPRFFFWMTKLRLGKNFAKYGRVWEKI